jgi:hypothetical protein
MFSSMLPMFAPPRNANRLSPPERYLALPSGRLWYNEPNAISNAIGYARFFSRARDVVICVYDEADNVIETHRQTGEFKEP